MAEPEQVWYGFCTFWTDDWGQLSTVAVSPTGKNGKAFDWGGGIPSCPECGSVGYQMDADDWWEGVQKVEGEEPGYYKFIKGLRNTCHGPGVSVGDLWKARKKEMEG